MKWTEIKPYPDSDTRYWISGIYKCLSYDGVHFHAYWITPVQNNWGDSVETAPSTDAYYHSRFWPSLESAQSACERHAQRHTPDKRVRKRAAEIMEGFLAAESANNPPHGAGYKNVSPRARDVSGGKSGEAPQIVQKFPQTSVLGNLGERVGN